MLKLALRLGSSLGAGLRSGRIVPKQHCSPSLQAIDCFLRRLSLLLLLAIDSDDRCHNADAHGEDGVD